MLKRFKNKTLWVLLGLLLIISVSFAVRAYHFEDWLYFKMDQSRDALLIESALENGPGYLPLLGARAGATEVDNGYLRLGPAYYYMQYVTGVLSGGNLPMSNAYPDLFFSIAVLPLLYVFLRLYFSRFNALLVTAMYAFSFLIIEYSRFAWNPNPLSFFFILSFYGLLKFFREDDFKKSLWWIALWSFGLAIGSQLHFFGFFSLLGISGLMLFWYWEIWKKENWKNYFSKTKLKALAIFGGVALGVFLFISAPIIISDVYRNGENSKNLMQALSSKPEKKPLLNKLEKNVSESFKYYCLLSTSECVTGDGFDKENILPAILVIILMMIGLGWAVLGIVRKKEPSKGKQDFLFLVIAWTAVFFILSIPVSYQIRPRFFIVVFAVPFILFGFSLKMMQEKFGKKGLWFSLIFTLIIIAWNTKGTLEWFEEQRLSQQGDIEIKRTLILKAKDGVTLGQLQRAVDFMYAKHKQGSMLYYYVKPEHVAPVKFLLTQKRDKNLQFSSLGKEIEESAQIFAITTTGDGMTAFETKFGKDFSVFAQEAVGQITVSEVHLRGLKIKKAETSFNQDKGKTDRIFWKDVFGLKEKDEIIEIEDTD
jgi:hypothetical protein